MTSMREITSMSVKEPDRLPSRSGDVCGMPSNIRNAMRPRNVSPVLLIAWDDSAYPGTDRASTAVASSVIASVCATSSLDITVMAPGILSTVSLLRETRQTAKLEVALGGRIVIPELVCDGILVATPAGSTAYNLSAQGPILPLGSSLLALTPISPFRPRRWRGALIPDTAKVEFRVLDAIKRPVSAVADQQEVRDVATVSVEIDRTAALTLLFDPEHALDERITMEQFAV